MLRSNHVPHTLSPSNTLLAKRSEERNSRAGLDRRERGLAGAFNANILRKAQDLLSYQTRARNFRRFRSAKKGRDSLKKRRGFKHHQRNTSMFSARVDFGTAREIRFAGDGTLCQKKRSNSVYIVFSEYQDGDDSESGDHQSCLPVEAVS